MAVRNFWIEARIDGRKTTLAGGPRSKDGVFNLNIYIRDKGDIAHALNITGNTTHDGGLLVIATTPHEPPRDEPNAGRRIVVRTVR